MQATELKETVLIVDDERGPRESLRMILKPSFDVHCASGGEEALRIIREQKVDLVTLDLNMPGVKGLEVLRSLRSESPTTEVIIVTGFATVESAVEGIRYGVHDFITKPFGIAEVMSAVESALRKNRALKQLHHFLDDLGDLKLQDIPANLGLVALKTDSSLFQGMRSAIQNAFDPISDTSSKERVFEFVEVLSDTLESKDEYTHGHSRRVGYYANLLADRSGLDAQTVEEIRLASFLHDIGKIGIPNKIIMKDGRLTADEHAVVAKHPEISESLILPLGLSPGVIRGVRHHHEQYDGNGYPDRIAGENIPIISRIILIADAFDAMNTNRPYRKGLPMEAIIREYKKHGGTQFDPELAAKFVEMLERDEELLKCEI